MARTGSSGSTFDYSARRQALYPRLERGALLLPAAPVRYKNADSEYRYRPDSELLYLTGWDQPDAVALIRGFAAEQRFVLFVPKRDAKTELWNGARSEPEECAERFGADAAYPIDELAIRAPELLADASEIWYRLGASGCCDRVVRAALGRGRARRVREGRGPSLLADPGALLDGVRAVKDPAEIECLRHAAEITVEAFREALTLVRGGAGEWEIEAALEGGFRARGADGPAFATIVAAGANACTLHYVANSGRIEEGDLVVVDAGAEFRSYAADTTRTVPASGRLSGLQRDLYEVVLAARGAALGVCAPSVELECVHRAAARVIANGLIELGVLDSSLDEALETRSYRRYFPHRTSHWLGLDTHDPGPYRSDGKPATLLPSMAITVEPGLYFPPDDRDLPDGLAGCGVRIEDDLLITAAGAEVLTAGLPVEVEDIGELMGGPPAPANPTDP